MRSGVCVVLGDLIELPKVTAEPASADGLVHQDDGAGPHTIGALNTPHLQNFLDLLLDRLLAGFGDPVRPEANLLMGFDDYVMCGQVGAPWHLWEHILVLVANTCNSCQFLLNCSPIMTSGAWGVLRWAAGGRDGFVPPFENVDVVNSGDMSAGCLTLKLIGPVCSITEWKFLAKWQGPYEVVEQGPSPFLSWNSHHSASWLYRRACSALPFDFHEHY